MIRQLPFARYKDEVQDSSPCRHRTVSKDGRIVCRKIAEGDNNVSPDLCRTCPAKASNCAHLRFSLRKTSPSRLVVRYNGRSEVWDDEPPEIHFQQAACAVQVLTIKSTRVCLGCALRKPEQAPAALPAPRRPAAPPGKVVPFPQREPVAARA